MSAVVLPLKRVPEPAVPKPPVVRTRAFEQYLLRLLRAEADRYVLWLPVWLGLGVALYFSMPNQPPAIVVGGAAALLAVVGAAMPARWRRFGWVPLALAAGLVAAALRTDLAAAPVLKRELGLRAVEGTVRWVEPLEAQGRLRLILEHPAIERVAANETPARVRLTLAGADEEPMVGDRVRVLASLSPPPGEIAPGSYNFARIAWFERIGAVGFAGGKLEVVAPAAQAGAGVARVFARLRASIQERIRAALPNREAAFATALIMGARAAIPHEDLLALQNSGLLHILSISGLHLALVAGLMMLVLRGALALIEPLALTWPLKKIAALLALGVSALYVALSGGDVATMRSFLMLGVAIGAVLIDRPALTLRTLAFAAVVLLLLAPEQLFNPSFQLSFAAVTALIAGYEWAKLRRANRPAPEIRWWTRPIRLVIGIAATTLLAEGATAPIAAYHFNQVVLGGLVANEIAIPLTGFWIMPLAVIAVLAMPFGLEALPLQLMGWGLDQLLALAHWTASLPFAVMFIEPWPVFALVLIVLGGLWLALWRTALRLGGVPLIVLGLVLGLAARGPDLITDESGAFVFRVRTNDAWRYGLVGVKPHSFKGEAWVRRLGGDPSGSPDAAKLMRCDALACIVPVGKGQEVSFVGDGRALREECAGSRVILSRAGIGDCEKAPLAIDPLQLRAHGPIALELDPSKPRLQVSARGQWPWQRPLPQRTQGDDDGGASPDDQ